MDKAMHLLAMELNLEKGLLALRVANSVVERKTQATMQSEVQTKELRKIGNLPLSHRLKVGNPRRMRTRKAASQLAPVQILQTRTG